MWCETNQIEKALYQDDECEISNEQSIPKKSEENIPSTAIVPSRLMRHHKLDEKIGDIKSGIMTKDENSGSGGRSSPPPKRYVAGLRSGVAVDLKKSSKKYEKFCRKSRI